MNERWRYWYMGRAYIVLLCLVVILGAVVRATPGRWEMGNPYPPSTVGYDVSWPNCGATPPQNSQWGVAGATGGLNFRAPKCLPLEASWFKQLSLYANTGYAGGQRAWPLAHSPKKCSLYDARCLAYDWGYAEGIYAVGQAAKHGLHASIWWLDVEIDNSWDDDPLVNRASIQGTYDGVRHATAVARIGIYSYPAQWNLITASWRPGWPAWAATASGKYEDAVAYCRQPSFTAGPLWLAQYTKGLDRDIVCPAPA